MGYEVWGMGFGVRGAGKKASGVRCQATDGGRQAGGTLESKNRDNLSRFFNKKAGNNLPILSVLCSGEN